LAKVEDWIEVGNPYNMGYLKFIPLIFWYGNKWLLIRPRAMFLKTKAVSDTMVPIGRGGGFY